MTSVIGIVLLLLSTGGIAGWFYIHRPPDPTYVTNLQDDGVGSLRWTIANAPTNSTITFDPSLWKHTILLTTDLTISRKRLNIRGPGAHLLTISNKTHKIDVVSGVSVDIFGLAFKGSKENFFSLLTNEGTLTLTNTIVSDNFASNAYSSGGGIDNEGGTLTLINSIVSNNTSSTLGGGIDNTGIAGNGTLTLINTIISSNTSYRGGGLWTNSKLTLISSTISDNTATDTGGGIDISDGTASLTSSTVSGNKAKGDENTSAFGGGISNNGTGMLTVTNSTISDNSVIGYGGGIDVNGAIGAGLTLTNSTVSGNTASTFGGGISNEGSQADVIFCTIYGNKASDSGGGLSIREGQDLSGKSISSQMRINKDIIAGNYAHSSPEISGLLTSGGYNLIQDITRTIFTPKRGDRFVSELSHVFANTVHLSNNGGPTQTLSLLPDPQNPVLNAIPLPSCQIKEIYDAHLHMYTDQRGMKRPGGKKTDCDVGAYESED